MYIFTENYYPFLENLNDGPSSMESTPSVRGILGSFPIEVSTKPLNPEVLDFNHMHTSPDNISTLPTSDDESSSALSPPHHNNHVLSTCASPMPTSPSGHIPSINPLSPSNLDHQTSPSHTRTEPLFDILLSLDQTKTLSCAQYPLPQCYFITSGPISKPTNYSSASHQSNWVQAMKDKYTTLIRNRT